MGFEAYSFTYGLTILTKIITLRPRPFLYNNLAPQASFEERDSRYAMFSGHTSFSAVGCFLTAKIFNDLHPDSPWRLPVRGLAATVPAVTGYLRVKGGKHFISDVMLGYGVGALIGWGIPALHKVSIANKTIDVYPTPGGVGMQLKF